AQDDEAGVVPADEVELAVAVDVAGGEAAQAGGGAGDFARVHGRERAGRDPAQLGAEDREVDAAVAVDVAEGDLAGALEGERVGARERALAVAEAEADAVAAEGDDDGVAVAIEVADLDPHAGEAGRDGGAARGGAAAAEDPRLARELGEGVGPVHRDDLGAVAAVEGGDPRADRRDRRE